MIDPRSVEVFKPYDIERAEGMAYSATDVQTANQIKLLEKLENRTRNLVDQIGILEDKLIPVLTMEPSEPRDAVDTQPTGSTQLNQSIIEITERISYQVTRINDLIERIDLPR